MSAMSDSVNFEKSGRQLSDMDFTWLEAQIGLALPPDVRAHYSTFNGGEPENYLYVTGKDRYVVQEFFSIRYGKPGHNIEDNYRELARNEKIIPNRLVPFAIDPAGDFYCFDSVTGHISIFRSENLPDLQKCITFLANSMSDFVEGLVEDDG